MESASFPFGLRVLVVDDDPIWLKILEKMLKKCSYKVTTCGLAMEALRVLREKKGGFDIVISDVNMPDMDGFKLLEHVGLEMDLPVIMMSVNGETSRVMKGVQHGACDYLLKPIRMKELKNIWQHVVRKRINEVIQSAHTPNQNQYLEDGYSLLYEDFTNSPRKRKESTAREYCSTKKARVVWSVDLHHKFVKAVDQIGYDKVGPKKILDLMKVPWLTRENVASHLQKYRLYLSRIQTKTKSEGSLCNPNNLVEKPKQRDDLVDFSCPKSVVSEGNIDELLWQFEDTNSVANENPLMDYWNSEGIYEVNELSMLPFNELENVSLYDQDGQYLYNQGHFF